MLHRRLGLAVVACLFVPGCGASSQLDGRGASGARREPPSARDDGDGDGRDDAAAAASPTPSGFAFPAAAPQSGDTRGCPPVAVLSRRFDAQNDHNGGGYGYYVVTIDPETHRPGSIGQPSEHWLDDYASNVDADQPDAGLAFLWGTYCAYPDLPYTERDLDAVRHRYLDATGVSPETERALHLAQADVRRWAAARRRTCVANLAPDDPERAAIVLSACGTTDDRTALGFALGGIDDGDASPLLPSAVVAECGRALDDRSTRAVAQGYTKYRECALVAATVTEDALRGALAGKDEVARLGFLASYERGVARVAKMGDAVAKYERGYPAAKQTFDKALADTQGRVAPLLAKWQPKLHDIDGWIRGLAANGPGTAGDCDAKYQALLARYAASRVPAASGNALLEALGDPIGGRIVGALALCRFEHGDQARAFLLRDEFLRRAPYIDGWHQALDAALGSSEGVLARFAPDPVMKTIDGDWTGDAFDFAEKVAGVDRQGDVATIHFAKETGTETWFDGCVPDYSHVVSIDDQGYFHYDQVGCVQRSRQIDETKPPVRVAAADAAAVLAGTVVAVKTIADGRYGEGSAQLAWVKRGKGVVWAAGVSSP